MANFRAQARDVISREFDRDFLYEKNEIKVDEPQAGTTKINVASGTGEERTAEVSDEQPLQYFKEYAMKEGDTIFKMMERNGFNTNDPEFIERVFFYNKIDSETAMNLSVGEIVIIPIREDNIVRVQDAVSTQAASVEVVTEIQQNNRRYNLDFFLGARKYDLSDNKTDLGNDYSDLFVGANYQHNKYSVNILKEGLAAKDEADFKQERAQLTLGYKIFESNNFSSISATLSKTQNTYDIKALDLGSDVNEVNTELNSIGLKFDFRLPTETLDLILNVSKPFSTSGTSSSKIYGTKLDVVSNVTVEAQAVYHMSDSISLMAMLTHLKEDLTFEKSGAKLQLDSFTTKIGAQIGF